jgi:hypothetical protein
VIVLKGLAIVTLADNSSSTVAASSGGMDMLFATDTPAVSEKGHGSYFPGITETIFMQIPTKDGLIPKHEVIHDNAPCSPREFGGLTTWAS